MTRADGVLLAHACAHALAQRSDARALSIKGIAADWHGLRPPRISADADVLVPPASWESLKEALGRCGWHSRPMSRTGLDALEHSTTLIHEQWPCDLDLHSSWPGFLGEDDEVFEVLWQRRVAIPVAGAEVFIPDRASSILIAVTHSFRSPRQSPRLRAEYERVVALATGHLTEEERTELVTLAEQLGAVDAARPFLDVLGVPLPPPVAPGVNPRLDAWRARIGADASQTSKLVLHLRRAPWREKPAALARALWPAEPDFRLDHPETPPGRGAATRGRIARLGRGLRAVPGVIRGRIAARRGQTVNPFADDVEES